LQKIQHVILANSVEGLSDIQLDKEGRGFVAV
jgi:hypothetical protein